VRSSDFPIKLTLKENLFVRILRHLLNEAWK
jgi:hypothetical protein